MMGTQEKHAGWRSRGYLPHCDAAGLVQHLVFGLADAVPDEPPADFDARMRAAWWDSAFDRGGGARCLQGEAADCVENALLHFDGARYALLAWCVMPNHVHVLLEQFPGIKLDRVVHTWKSFTANKINRIVGRTGQLWRREYFDRYIRDLDHFLEVRHYIEHNPVVAGLAECPEAWRWSSASKGG